MRPADLAAAAGVVALTFAVYHATMLPGMDLGDTPSFQTRIGSPVITPRDGYPLYTAIGNLFHSIGRPDAARALNLASVAQGAVACGVIALLAAELTASTAAGIAVAFLFAGSYTFWSQSVIAEVYALHILFVALTLLLALQWEKHPTIGRLTTLLAVFAVGFGNHLSMVLLAPGLAIFLLSAAPGGWRSLFVPRVMAMALGCAIVGALPYVWNLHSLWLLPDPPASIAEGLQRFWFDVTKADWRETMILEVPRGVVADRLAMYAFDVRQQFGWIVPAVAVFGLAILFRTRSRRAWLLAIVYAANFLFAFGYNVGDKHVFYLPAHLIIALLAGAGVAAAGRMVRLPHAGAALLLLYAAAHAWIDYPALDRSRDTRPFDVIAALTSGLTDRDSVLLADLNWQVQNGLSYFGKAIAPEVAYERLPAVLLYAPAFVADNLEIGREIVVNERAREMLYNAYGPLLPSTPDLRAAEPRLAAVLDTLPDRTRYVFCILTPTRDLAVDWDETGAALAAATGGQPLRVPNGEYVAIAGVTGRPPDLVFGSNRPFQRSLVLDGVAVTIRMDSWLSADTIRRMGFGHVIAARRHTLIVERGVSFVAFDDMGEPIQTVYAANIFAPQQRYLIERR